MTLYMTIEPVHLLSEVTCNNYIIMYSEFSTGNYTIAGTRGHWKISHYLTLPYINFYGGEWVGH